MIKVGRYNNKVARYIGKIVKKNTDILIEWVFDNNTNDNYGNFNLTNESGFTYTTGKVGQCMVWPGSKESYNTDVRLRRFFDANNPYSINFWFYVSYPNLSLFQKILFGCDGLNTASYKRNWILIGPNYNSSTNIIFERANKDVLDASCSCYMNVQFDSSTWNNVCIVYNGQDASLYFNNVLYPTLNKYSWDEGKAINMGYTDDGGNGNTIQTTLGGNRQNNRIQFIGRMDQFRIYNYAISQNDVSVLWNNGNGI